MNVFDDHHGLDVEHLDQALLVKERALLDGVVADPGIFGKVLERGRRLAVLEEVAVRKDPKLRAV